MTNEWIENELDLYENAHNIKLNKEEIKGVIEIFKAQGHSGFSASYAIGYIKRLILTHDETKRDLEKMLKSEDKDGTQKLITDNIFDIYNACENLNVSEVGLVLSLLDHKPLTPLTGEDDEWGEIFDDNIQQNKRCSAVFREKYDNGLIIPYYLDDAIYSDDGGLSFYTTNKFGRKEITFPFTIPENSQSIYLYYNEEGMRPIILTNPETIKKLKSIIEDKKENEAIIDEKVL